MRDFLLTFAAIMEENAKYYETYEENLLREMLRMCTSLGMLDGELLASEDIDQKWKEWAPEYIAEALPEVNSYPELHCPESVHNCLNPYHLPKFLLLLRDLLSI